ncbi:MAG: zinc ribbon domain-containing protein [Moraxellaceae bacterium]|nr:zinc ribbon domain-containing protein [Moraxellaceae bacterium]
MPIYEYRCGDCGHQKEHLQKFSDAPVAACPACGSDTYQKLLSAAGFQLKGSGWYATDFKGGSSSKASSSPAAEAPKAEAAKSEAGGGSTPCGGSCACH